jgi:heterodisulfide reductase subunit C
LFSGAKKEVIENISDEEVLNQSKSEETNDLTSKQTYSNTEEKNSTNSSKNEKSEDEKPQVIEVDVKEDSEDSKASKVSKEEKVENSKSDDKSDDKSNKKDNKNNKENDSMTLLEENENKLTLESVDPEFTQLFIDAGIDSVEYCFQCGTCTGGCPSGRRTPYRVRQIVRKCLMGLKDEVISDDALWMCTTCYTCQERCPREIKIVEIIKKARNEAAKAGYMAPAHKATGSFVIKTGHGVPINDATQELRKRVGLDELPPTTHSFPEALKEIQTITEATGFDDLIGYNKKTGELE